MVCNATFLGGPQDGQKIMLPNCNNIEIKISPVFFWKETNKTNLEVKTEWWLHKISADGKHYIVHPKLAEAL